MKDKQRKVRLQYVIIIVLAKPFFSGITITYEYVLYKCAE